MSAPRVLAVVDDPTIREVVERVLVDDGCQVRAPNGDRDALRLMRQWRPDVLLLELRVPDREAEAFLQACRQQLAHETPILVLSASSNLIHHAERLQVNGILPMPFDIDDLCTTVQQLAVGAARPPVDRLVTA